MMSAPARRATVPSLRLATLLVAFAALASCSDSSTGPKFVSSVAKMHLVFTSGATVTTLDVTTNKEELRTVHIPTNVPTTVAATFFRADGSADPTVTATAFKLVGTIDVFGSSPPIAYTASTTSLTGTLLCPVVTQVNTTGFNGGAVGFQLVNVADGVVEFGPWTVTVISP